LCFKVTLTNLDQRQRCFWFTSPFTISLLLFAFAYLRDLKKQIKLLSWQPEHTLALCNWQTNFSEDHRALIFFDLKWHFLWLGIKSALGPSCGLSAGWLRPLTPDGMKVWLGIKTLTEFTSRCSGIARNMTSQDAGSTWQNTGGKEDYEQQGVEQRWRQSAGDISSRSLMGQGAYSTAVVAVAGVVGRRCCLPVRRRHNWRPITRPKPCKYIVFV